MISRYMIIEFDEEIRKGEPFSLAKEVIEKIAVCVGYMHPAFVYYYILEQKLQNDHVFGIDRDNLIKTALRLAIDIAEAKLIEQRIAMLARAAKHTMGIVLHGVIVFFFEFYET